MQCLVQSIVRELLSAANLRTIISVSAATTAQKLITLASRAEQTLGAAGRDLAHSVEQAVNGDGAPQQPRTTGRARFACFSHKARRERRERHKSPPDDDDATTAAEEKAPNHQ